MQYITSNNHKDFLGKRIEIPVHYDMWMQGATMGTVTAFRRGKAGLSDYLLVRMDNVNVRKSLKLWRLDWEYAKVF